MSKRIMILILGLLYLTGSLCGLNFTETWDSQSFDTNGWTFAPQQGNWAVFAPFGNPAPTARCTGMPPQQNYETALVSPAMDALNSASVIFMFDVKANLLMPGTEMLDVDVSPAGGDWVTLETFSENTPGGDMDFDSRTYDLTSMVAGTTFQIRFRAYGADSMGLIYWAVDNIHLTDSGAPQPGVVQGLITDQTTGNPVENADVTIDGNTQTTGSDGFYTFSLDAGDYTVFVEADGYLDSQTDVTVQNDQIHTVNFALTPLSIFPVPQNLTVSLFNDNWVDLAWQAPDNGTPTGYRVWRNDQMVAETTPDTLFCVDEDVPNGTYDYTVTAVYDQGESLPCEPVTLMIHCVVPPDINILEIHYNHDVSQYGIFFQWQEMEGDTSDLIGYNIYRNGEMYNDTPIPPSGIPVQTVHHFDVVNTHTYEYRISSVYVEGESELSDPQSLVFLLPPHGLWAIPWTDRTELAWYEPQMDDLALPFNGYHVYRFGDKITTEPVMDPEYVDTQVFPGEIVNYNVTAVYDTLESVLSMSAEVNSGYQIINPPTALSGIVEENSVELHWNRPAGCGEWLHYDTAHAAMEFGDGVPENFTAAIHFDEWDMVNQDGQFPTILGFIPTSINTTYQLRVWSNDLMDPTQLVEVMTVPIDNPEIGVWNQIELPMAIYVQTGLTQFIFGVECSASPNPAIMLDGGPNENEKSDMIMVDGAWSNLSDDFGIDANWKIRVLFEDAGSGGCRILNSRLDHYNLYRDGQMVMQIPAIEENFTDFGLEPGSYQYTVSALFMIEGIEPYESDSSEPFEVEIIPTGAGQDNAAECQTAMQGCFPNPFNPETRIRFSLHQAADVRLDIYNVRGQLVRTLVNQRLDAGNHSAIWSGRNDRGQSVSSGIYFCRFTGGGVSQTHKLMLMK